MQDIKKINDGFSVTGQITVGDIPAICAKGFKGIICNRPDHEEAGQPTWVEIENAARQAGLATQFAPLAGRDTTKEALAGFVRGIAEIDGPVLAFCRTGARSEILWNATQAFDRAAE